VEGRGLPLKSVVKICLFLGLFGSLLACTGQGGAALDGVMDGGSPVGGPVGGGQGQPTIAPGADHEPGVPIDEEDDGGPTDIAAPAPGPDEPEEPKPNFQGATDFKK